MSLLHSFKQYTQAEWRGMKLGLERMQQACEKLDHPERQFSSIHIAGTNGKGSVAAMLHSILSQAGYRVGLFTSPHLVRVNERFRIGDEEISDQELEEILETIFNPLSPRAGEGGLSFFELCTLIAFQYFAKRKVDLAIIEVGLGGRLDATNVITPLVSVITEISLDHTEILGPTLAAIAREKAGIIKKNIPVVCGARKKEAKQIIEKISQDQEAPFYSVTPPKLHEDGSFDWENFFHLKTSLAGPHQAWNSAIALTTLKILSQVGANHHSPLQVMDKNVLRRGLASTKWPGRLEWISQSPPILLDGAHNPAGIQALVKAIQELSSQPKFSPSLPVLSEVEGRGGDQGEGDTRVHSESPSPWPSPIEGRGEKRWKILFGAVQEKAIASMLQELQAIASEIVLCRLESPRSADPFVLVANVSLSVPLRVSQENAFETFQEMVKNLKPSEKLLVTGSLYLVGEIKRNKESYAISHPSS